MMRRGRFVVFCAVAAVIPIDQARSDSSDVYSLYRDSPFLYEQMGPPKSGAPNFMRVHIATFDTPEVDATYNRSNCLRVAELFTAELTRPEGPKKYYSRFWCEPGRYEPEAAP